MKFRTKEQKIQMVSLFKYTDTEIKNIMKTMTIIVDTREQRNEHIISYLDKKKVPYRTEKLDYGDYSAIIPANKEYGIIRELHFPIAIERKNSVDELANTIKERTRFENELIRAQRGAFHLMIEDSDGYNTLIFGRYRSKYNAKALLGTLKAFEARYNFSTSYIDPNVAGNYIYHHLYYAVREFLKL